MRRTSLSLLALALLLVLAVPALAQSLPAGLTKDNPIIVDKAAGKVIVLAEVNGKYFYSPTRHAVISKDGNFGDKSVFRAYATPKSFHDGLKEIGAVPGENMTLANKETTNVQGDTLAVNVTWDGAPKAYEINEVIRDYNGKPIDIKFGGNLTNSLDKNTGCLICLDSCPVGIASNTTYTYGAIEVRKEVEFFGKKDVLPADGTLVAVIVSLKK